MAATTYFPEPVITNFSRTRWPVRINAIGRCYRKTDDEKDPTKMKHARPDLEALAAITAYLATEKGR